MRNKNVILTISYVGDDNEPKRNYFNATYKNGYLDFLTTGLNDREEYKLTGKYKLSCAYINGEEAKYLNIGTFRKELNNAKGNIWILEVVIPKRECIYKIVGNTNAGKAIAKAFDKLIAKLELNPSNVSWICSSQFNMKESRLYFLFYEKEPTFFNQGTNEYAYRKGRVDLDILAYFKAELLRGINHLSSNGFGYDELYRMYLK